jgi:glycogen debranching enzyme
MDDIFLQKAKDILIKNDIGIGIKAGDYYPDLWGRDVLISSLGMVASKDKELVDLARRSIETISKYQKFTGQIPNKICPAEKKVCFGEGGCIDSSLWYPISVLNYYKQTKDLDFLKNHFLKMKKAINFVLCLDQNNDWLIETNEGSDWMDLLIRSGRVLYDNVLLYKALRDMGQICKILKKDGKYEFVAENLRESINLFFWPTEGKLEDIKEKYGHTGIEKDVETVLFNQKEERNIYITDLGFRKYDPRFDSFANILAILFDVADLKKKEKILKYIEKEKVDEPYPIKVLYPPIYKDDPFWDFYFRWTELPYLQEPGNYHNGGIWPFVGGFYVAALKKEEKPFKKIFNNLVKSCELNNWRFSEWLNSKGEPCGSANQSWSAALLLYAYYI